MNTFVTRDQMGRELRLPVFPPRRIVSLVPSQTELLYALGLRDEVVGITKFCVHPDAWFRSKPRIGGTKTPHIERIRALRPDLVLANKEENTREAIAQLEELGCPVWVSDVRDLPGALAMIREVGALTGRSEAAADLCAGIGAAFSAIPPVVRLRRAAYLIWRKPYMAAGSDTFIDDMLTRAGFQNVFAGMGRYPELSLEQLAEAAPEWVLLSSEPYPFKDRHIEELRSICPGATLRLVDGELFSWYGSRLLKTGPCLATFASIPDLGV